MVKLTNTIDVRNELRSTCTPKVNEMIFKFIGPNALNAATKTELLDHIKSVAVKAVQPEVYRQQFFVMRQSDGESTTSYISRLKAQAMLCAFTCAGSCRTATCIASYSEDMIKSQLIAGIRNPAHQSNILSEMAQLTPLELLTTRLLTLESTERATTHFRSPFERLTDSEVTPIRSDYQKSKTTKSQQLRQAPPYKESSSRKCSGCGKQYHPTGRHSCPAWGKTCNKCKRTNHFAAVCRSSSTATILDDDDTHMSHLASVQTSPL